MTLGKPTRLWSGTGAALLVGALLAGCSPAGENPDQPNGPSELRISQGTDARTLDPLDSTFTFDQNVYGQVVETLLVFSPDAKETKPHLATAVTAVDPTTWRIELRTGVTFHNGEPMNAEAVKFSLEKLVASKAYAPFAPSIMSSISVDGQAIVVKTSKPAPSLPVLLARAAWIYPPAYTRQAGTGFASKPVGTGPFKFESWQRDDKVVLTAYDGYWGGRSTIDRVVFRSIPDASARIAALEAGEIDLIYDLPMDQVKRVDGHADLKVVSAASLRPYEVYLDYRQPGSPLADKRVRQALNYAIDKQGIVDGLFLGYGKPLKGQPMAEEYLGANPDLAPYPHDVEKAKTLLREAGVPNLELKLNCPQGRYVLDKSACETIASQLKAAGVNATVTVLEPGAYAQTMAATKLGPAFYAGFLTPPDASYYYAITAPGSAYRYFADNAAVDALVAQAGAETNSDRRLDLYRQAAQLLHDDPVAIYLWTVDSVYGLADRVKDWMPNSDESLNLRGVSVG